MEPLYLFKSYEPGLLPTPNVRPLRHVVWVDHPVLKLENILNEFKKQRPFTTLEESKSVLYKETLRKRYLCKIYGYTLGNLSIDNEEAQKLSMENSYSSETQQIFDMLQTYLVEYLTYASYENSKRTRSSRS